MKLFVMLLISVFLSGCAAQSTLFVPSIIQNTGRIAIYVAPVLDESREYQADIALDARLKTSLENEFKGIWSNASSTYPSFTKHPNPYIITSSPDSADLIVRAAVEQFYFGEANHNSVAGGFFVLGPLGALMAADSNRKVGAIIRGRIELSDRSGKMIFSKPLSGQSNLDYPDRVSRAIAMREAADKFNRNAFLIFCESNATSDAHAYKKSLK